MKTAARPRIRVFHGFRRPTRGRAGPSGVFVSDLIFLLLTVALFAVLGLLVRAVEKL